MPAGSLRVAPLPPGAKPFDVVACGECSLDLVAVVDRLPAPDEKHSIDALELLPGGQAATAAVTCARQRWRARYAGCLGTDEWGAAIEAALRRAGVDVAAVRREGVRSRAAVILVERASGRRSVLEHRDPRLALRPEEVDTDLVTSGRVLIVDAVDVPASLTAARAARAAGIPVVLDLDRVVSGVDALLSSADIVITAESFPRAFTGLPSLEEGLQALADRFHPALAVATLGPAGSLAVMDAREIRTPAPEVRVVDTTGAGDAFRGGFVSGWLRLGAEAGVDTLLEYANATAALSCMGLGAQAALPTREAVDAVVTGITRGQSN